MVLSLPDGVCLVSNSVDKRNVLGSEFHDYRNGPHLPTHFHKSQFLPSSPNSLSLFVPKSGKYTIIFNTISFCCVNSLN